MKYFHILAPSKLCESCNGTGLKHGCKIYNKVCDSCQGRCIKENIKKVFYHGSNTKLKVGTILKPRGEAYENDWGHQTFYQELERNRPENMLSHKDAIFMCDNPDDIDAAGGGTEWVFTVEPLGPVQRHDINWGSEIEAIISEHYGEDGDDDVATSSSLEKQIRKCAENYWNGVPHTNESVWEYLTPSAKILKVERY